MSLYHQARERHWPGGGAVIGRPVHSRRSLTGKGTKRFGSSRPKQVQSNPYPPPVTSRKRRGLPWGLWGEGWGKSLATSRLHARK